MLEVVDELSTIFEGQFSAPALHDRHLSPLSTAPTIYYGF
ncbi:MAG: hypothetical protein AVDCRST_MAG18-1681 [uncultured Thermomicrobiales bacterium]|uniref:Uncharacterized protein n=1 Tax=uncultured Thermomicrobiales bacterium TaxID=1645740 RepID=A0A6J4V372_9BACT|nr:MAG: hypothetical protein AVDCRST_MAG18-1681 [uncultured Thermomicrobiales bacterium]